MVIIKTVLKSSGQYSPEHVRRIREQLRQHVRIPYKFVCYSDQQFPIDGEIRPLLNKWPGYWSKIELFRDVEESFYIDLDMTISGDITEMVERKSSFCALRNMTPRIAGIGSALMKWEGDHRYLYEIFELDPTRHMKENARVGTPFLGDQGFIYRYVKDIEHFQKLFPGKIERFDERLGAPVKVYYGRFRPWK